MKLEENLQSLILNELKSMGVHIQKSKKRITNCKKNQSTCYESCPDQIFGVSLASQEWITVDCHGTPVPRFLAISTEYLLQHKQCEGLFRKTGSITRQRELRKCIENGGNIKDSIPHDVTSLLKQWFRELPEPVIPKNLYDIFLGCYQLEENRTAACLLACLLLPPDHLYTLQHTVNFLSNIAKHSSQNKMNSFNLAVIMAPNLLPDSKQSNEKTRLQNCHPDNWKRRSRNSPATDTLDLRSLIEYQTGLIHLLIENEDKVGHFPSDIAEKFGSLGVIIQEEGENDKSVEGLEKSDELAEGPPKAKKKRRSGTVQELVSGIRKFVTQKRTPLQSLPVTSDACSPMKFTGQDRHNSPVCRSASKRKAETNCKISVHEKEIHQKMTLDSKFIKIPETNGVLHLTPVLSPCAMISLSDIDCDSPADVKCNPSPMVQTHRKSLRIIKNKQRQRNASIRPRKNVKLCIKNTVKSNLVAEVDVHESEVAETENENKSKEVCSPDVTIHVTRQVSLLSLLSPNQMNTLPENNVVSHQIMQLNKSLQNIKKQEKNNINDNENLITNKIENNVDTLQDLCSKKKLQSQRCSKSCVLQEKKIDKSLKENKIHRQQNYKIITRKENLVRKVGSTRTGKNTSKTKLERHISSSSVKDKEIHTATNGKKTKPERKHSSRLTAQKNLVITNTNNKTKIERKISSCSARNKEIQLPISFNVECKVKLPRKTSSCSITEKEVTIITNEECKTKLEETPLSLHSISSNNTVNPGNKVRSRTKSSLRRGRPNTITTGLPSSIYGKYYSDSIVYKNTKSCSHTNNSQIHRNIITRSVSSNNLHIKEPIISRDMFLPEINESRNKTSIILTPEDSLITKVSSNSNSFEGLDQEKSRNSICSTPLENINVKKSLFMECDSNNDSPSNPTRKLSDTIHSEYSVPDNKNCSLNSKVNQVKERVVEMKNSINLSLIKADSVPVSAFCLQLDQDKDDGDMFIKSMLNDNSHLKHEHKTQKNKKVEDSGLLVVDKPNLSGSMNENSKGFLTDSTLDTPKEPLLLTETSKDLLEMPKGYEESQWTSASEYLSKQENEVYDYTKRESIIKLRIKNAGMVKANVMRYNSIGGNTSFCTPEICRTHNSQSPASVCIPNAFIRNGIGTKSLYEKPPSLGWKNSANSKLTNSAPKPNSSSTNNEFKMPTPFRKARKQSVLRNKENMGLRNSCLSLSPADVF